MLMMMGSNDGEGAVWAPDEKRINKLVFIGRNLDSDALNASFRSCIIDVPKTRASSRQAISV